MEWENYNQQSDENNNQQSDEDEVIMRSDENECDESNRRSKKTSREKKQKKHKKNKKHKHEKKHKKSKRDKTERTDRGEDGSLPSSSCSKKEVNGNIDTRKYGRVSSNSGKEDNGHKKVRKDGGISSSSEKEVNGNIDDLFPKSDANCSCVRDNNGEKSYVCHLCQNSTDISSDDDDDNQKAMDSLNNNTKICDGDNPPPVSISEMQLVLNKFRPYLSLPAEDEPNLMKRLNDLGVEGVNDLKFLNFETDLQGIMKIIQCRKLKLELLKDVTMYESINTHSEIHNASSSAVEHKRPPLTQPTAVLNNVIMQESITTESEIHDTSSSAVEHKRPALAQPTAVFNFTMPQFQESVRKSLEIGVTSNDDRLYIVRTVSLHMLDVKSNVGTQECKHVVRMLEMQFPNAFKNKESGFSVEYLTKTLLKRVIYLKRKKQQELKQRDSQLQNYHAFLKNFHQKKIKYGTRPERYAPAGLPKGESPESQDRRYTWLKYKSMSRNKENVNWDVATRCMDFTYGFQRYTITKSKSVGKILLEWPYLGRENYLRRHFYYLANTEETALNHFYKTIPTMFKFVQAEAEKKRKNNDLQIKLMAIIKNNRNKNAYDELLTVILFFMAFMKENADHMFIEVYDVLTFSDLVASAKVSSIPAVYSLGDMWSNPNCYVLVEKQCLWSEPLKMQDAIEIMFMSYYVFNLEYPKELAGILQFLQSYMFNLRDESNRIEKCVPKLLKLMNGYENYVKKVAERTTA